jgi:alpha/beta superfamily hydrolase
MHNGVVRSIARALSDRGVLALRFNFRGVGRSGGKHDKGQAEQEDVAGALDWLLNQPGVDPERIVLVGYSFGAWVGLSLAQRDLRVTATAAVGLVAWHDEPSLFSSGALAGLGQFEPDFLKTLNRPKLFITGEYDSFAPPEAVRVLVERLPPPNELRILGGTDHFFAGREAEVGELVADFIAAL